MTYDLAMLGSPSDNRSTEILSRTKIVMTRGRWRKDSNECHWVQLSTPLLQGGRLWCRYHCH